MGRLEEHRGGPAGDGRASRSDRGVALVVVLTGVAILAAFSTEFSYRTRVDIQVASNLERRIQAYFHARSAMEIARLVITSQKFVDQAVSAFGGGVPGLSRGNFELWRYACKFAEIFSSSTLNFMGLEIMNLKGSEGIGVEEGGFACEVVPEDSRINLNASLTAQDRRAMFTKLYALLRGQVDEEAGPRDDRKAVELILNIMDWTDPDDERSDIDSNGNFVQAAGAGENVDYAKYGYRTRNAKMDTVEEVRLVEGMTDDLFCRFGRQFTVYPTEKLNVNEAELLLIKSVVCDNLLNADPLVVCGVGAPVGVGGWAHSMPPMDMALGLLEVCRTIKRALFTPPFASENDFISFFSRLPEPLNQAVQVNPTTLRAIVGTRTKVLRVTARGWAGESGHQIEAVIDTSSLNYLYWRETGFDATRVREGWRESQDPAPAGQGG